MEIAEYLQYLQQQSSTGKVEGKQPPEEVSWSKLSEALNIMWSSHCGSDRSLTKENMHYLACRAFRNPRLDRDQLENLLITWSQFCMEPLPDRSFSFWEWFYRTMILTSNHLRGPWSEGYIMGFVSKQEVEQILLDEPMLNGTFILRFSESEIGITIAYVRQNPENDGRQVLMIAPFTSDHLSQRSIADVVCDLQESLLVVHQSPMEGGPKPKEVFHQFLSENYQPRCTGMGYVPVQLKTHLREGTGKGYMKHPDSS